MRDFERGCFAIEGQGLHTGARSAISFARHDGPVVVRVNAAEARIDELRVVETARSTTAANASNSMRIATIEHVFAALGGLGIHSGVVVRIEGPEVPLADGGARAYVDALRSLAIAPAAPPLRVVRDGIVEIGKSRYELRRLDFDAVELELELDFDDDRIVKEACWRGDAADFAVRIASARTFGFEHEVTELMARGLASHVIPESVVVIGKDRILSRGAPFTPDEPARHKLLDLIGDLYLYGGPPRGYVRATRPGHAATHEFMRQAFDQALVARDADTVNKPSSR